MKGSTKAKDGYELTDVIKWMAKCADTIILVWGPDAYRMSDAIRDLFQVEHLF